MNRWLPYALILVILLIPLAANAQVVGVTPDSGFSSFVNWMQGPLGRPLITLGFLGMAIVMLCGRHTFEGIVFGLLGATFYAGAGGLANLVMAGAGAVAAIGG